MKSFKEYLGANNEQIKQSRVVNAARTASSVSRQRVENLKNNLRNLENQYENITDIYPDTSVDLNAALKDFDAQKFVESVAKTAEDIYYVAQSIVIMSNIHNKLFPDDKVEALDSYDMEFVNDIAGDLWYRSSVGKQEE